MCPISVGTRPWPREQRRLIRKTRRSEFQSIRQQSRHSWNTAINKCAHSVNRDHTFSAGSSLTFHALFPCFPWKKKEKNIKAHQVRFAQTWHCVSSGAQNAGGTVWAATCSKHGRRVNVNTCLLILLCIWRIWKVCTILYLSQHVAQFSPAESLHSEWSIATHGVGAGFSATSAGVDPWTNWTSS